MDGDVERSLAVLRIASTTRNSVTQFYPDRVQISAGNLNDLNRKVFEKLRLHRINQVKLSASLQFRNDKNISFSSVEELQRYDFQTDSLTQLLTLKWIFLFNADDDTQSHLHSVYVRVSERPSPGLLLQKYLSGQNEDIDSLENETFAAVACKVDFFDNRFSSELLSVVTEWVKALPRAEATFGFFNWLAKHDDTITSFVYGTLPATVVLGYIGVWLGLLPHSWTESTRLAVAWMLGGGVVFLVSRYVARRFNQFFEGYLRRICTVPVFQLTAGDKNRLTKYMAQSQQSMFKLGAAGLVYGIFKAVGLYLATYVLRAWSS